MNEIEPLLPHHKEKSIFRFFCLLIILTFDVYLRTKNWPKKNKYTPNIKKPKLIVYASSI